MFGLHIRDTDCDFRLLRKQALVRVTLVHETGVICVEMVRKLQDSGALVGLVFGQMQGATLKLLAGLASGLRLAPWRMVLIEGLGEMPQHPGLVTEASDPILRATACTGAPACPQAYAETRALAAALAPSLASDMHLHVSGCAKGCAHPGASSITLVGTEDGFDLIRDGCTRDIPAARRLDPAIMLADPARLLGVG